MNPVYYYFFKYDFIFNIITWGMGLASMHLRGNPQSISKIIINKSHNLNAFFGDFALVREFIQVTRCFLNQNVGKLLLINIEPLHGSLEESCRITGLADHEFHPEIIRLMYIPLY